MAFALRVSTPLVSSENISSNLPGNVVTTNYHNDVTLVSNSPLTMTTSKNGLLMVDLENTSAGNAVVVGSIYRIINDKGYWTGLGQTGQSTLAGGAYTNSGHLYSQGYEEFLITNDGNDPIIFSVDVSDGHNYGFSEVARIMPDTRFRVGTGNANNVIIDDEYGIVLSGNATVWEDLRFPASRIRQGATQKPDFDTTDLGLLFPENDETEIAYLVVQMPHSQKLGSNICPHIHYQQDEAGTPNFVMEYRWYELGDTSNGAFTTITTNKEDFTYTTGTIHQLLEFPEIDGSGILSVSSLIDIKLYRQTGDGISGEVLLKEFDIHYERDTMGSRTESAK